jgi:hypothetical protein
VSPRTLFLFSFFSLSSISPKRWPREWAVLWPQEMHLGDTGSRDPNSLPNTQACVGHVVGTSSLWDPAVFVHSMHFPCGLGLAGNTDAEVPECNGFPGFSLEQTALNP